MLALPHIARVYIAMAAFVLLSVLWIAWARRLRPPSSSSAAVSVAVVETGEAFAAYFKHRHPWMARLAFGLPAGLGLPILVLVGRLDGRAARRGLPVSDRLQVLEAEVARLGRPCTCVDASDGVHSEGCPAVNRLLMKVTFDALSEKHEELAGRVRRLDGSLEPAPGRFHASRVARVTNQGLGQLYDAQGRPISPLRTYCPTCKANPPSPPGHEPAYGGEPCLFGSDDRGVEWNGGDEATSPHGGA